jgi:hypothetical protein
VVGEFNPSICCINTNSFCLFINLGNNNLTITVKDWSANGSNCVSVVQVLPFSGLKSPGSERDSNPLDENTAFSVFPNPSTGTGTLAFELSKEEDNDDDGDNDEAAVAAEFVAFSERMMCGSAAENTTGCAHRRTKSAVAAGELEETGNSVGEQAKGKSALTH